VPCWSLRHSTSVTVEDSTTTDNTWIGGGKRRQAGPIEGVRKLYAYAPGRSEVVPIARNKVCPPHPMPGEPSSSWTSYTSQQCASQQEMARLDRGGTCRNKAGTIWEAPGKGRECKRAHSGPLPLAKDNPSNQSSALEPATACLEGRVSHDRRSFGIDRL